MVTNEKLAVMYSAGLPKWFPFLLIGIPVVMMLVRLGTAPPLWFDEGWVLAVARNWVETGHYGQFNSGLPIHNSMPNVGLLAVAPVALSFRLLGIGGWQGRLPSVLFTAAALAAAYFLAKHLYSRSTGLWTLVVLVWATPLSPVLIGKQVLGEVPALLFYLLGLLSLTGTPHRHWRALPAALFWGASLATKVQLAPFWAVSVLLPCALALWRRRDFAALLFFSFAGSLAVGLILHCIPGLLFGSKPPNTIALVSVAGAVFAQWVRIRALRELIRSGLPTLVGITYELHSIANRLRELKSWGEETFLRLGLLTFAAAFMCWYMLLSPAWDRYLFPSLFVGGFFLGRLADVTSRHFVLFLSSGSHSDQARRSGWIQFATASTLLILCVWMGETLRSYYDLYVHRSSDAIYAVDAFLNEQTPADSTIETYDMELLFLLKRKYHFPSERVQLALNENMSSPAGPIHYDPMEYNPDYLVIGQHSTLWHLYDSVIQAGQFRLVRRYGNYFVYQRQPR